MNDPYFRGIRTIDPKIEFDAGYKPLCAMHGNDEQRAAMLKPFEQPIKKMQREQAEARYKARHHVVSRADITRKRPAVNIKPLTPDNIK